MTIHLASVGIGSSYTVLPVQPDIRNVLNNRLRTEGAKEIHIVTRGSIRSVNGGDRNDSKEKTGYKK